MNQAGLLCSSLASQEVTDGDVLKTQLRCAWTPLHCFAGGRQQPAGAVRHHAGRHAGSHCQGELITGFLSVVQSSGTVHPITASGTHHCVWPAVAGLLPDCAVCCPLCNGCEAVQVLPASGPGCSCHQGPMSACTACLPHACITHLLRYIVHPATAVQTLSCALAAAAADGLLRQRRPAPRVCHGRGGPCGSAGAGPAAAGCPHSAAAEGC